MDVSDRRTICVYLHHLIFRLLATFVSICFALNMTYMNLICNNNYGL